MKHLLLRCTMLVLVLFASKLMYAQLAEQKPGPFNVSLYKGAKWRNVGPHRGGRSVTVTGVPGNDQVYYMGTTGGGVWKTEDAGISWFNISDGFFNVGSIGAITLAPSDPNVIYVGTGEHPIRGVMTSHGDGVYRSTDAGKTWEHIGLEESRQISEIVIHPNNPDFLYVAVQGAPYGPTMERGVYRSQNGGQSWEQVLHTNEHTGAADLSMDPDNPRILYAAMWDHERKPWQIRSGGRGSGIYKTSDGGLKWTSLSNGLPTRMGKIGVTVSPANSDIVYANIEAEEGGVYRSKNGGINWEQVCADRVTFARAWYYMEVVADPTDEHTVYVLNAPLLRSIDGGKRFTSIENPHSDQHDLWINPDNPKNMILANDGGACVTFNGGKTWSSQMNQPTGQFYRVIADHRFPYYYIYGGQQDNSAIAIASRTDGAGIGQSDWYSVSGGESAFIAFDPDDPKLIYGGSYQGNISVFDDDTKEIKDVMAYPTVGLATLPRDMKYRFNWNAPIVAAPHDPRVIYHAAQRVLRTFNGGISWQELGPDLTRNEKEKQGPGGVPFTNEGAGGENYNTISYLACSPHEPWVLWAGSDDGLVHLTRDEGQNWVNVTPPELEEAIINCIEVSPHQPATAYVVAMRYKFNDFTPLLYKTEDYGETWTRITRGISPEDFVRVIREDPYREGMLYVGTETGLYISYSKGNFWYRFQANLPVCPINDLTIQDNDLIAATSGRGFWILDDLGFLRQSAGYLMGNSPQVFRPKDTYRLAGSNTAQTDDSGQNPPPGMLIDYYLPREADSLSVELEIVNEEGEVIRRYSSESTQAEAYFGAPKPEATLPSGYGIHRFNWDLRRKPIQHIDDIFVLGDYTGSLVAPGNYTLRLRVGGKMYTEGAQLLPDPRLPSVNSDYLKQQKILNKIAQTVSDIHNSVSMMQELREQMQQVRPHLDTVEHKALLAQADTIVARIDRWTGELVQPEQQTFQDVINFPNRLNAEFMNLHDRCDSVDPRLTEGVTNRLNDLLAAWEKLRLSRDEIIEVEMGAFNTLYAKMNLPGLFLPKQEVLDAW